MSLPPPIRRGSTADVPRPRAQLGGTRAPSTLRRPETVYGPTRRQALAPRGRRKIDPELVGVEANARLTGMTAAVLLVQ